MGLGRIVVLVVALAAASAWAGPVVVKVDVGERHQVMEGFGASGAWWPSWVGEFPAEKREEILDLLFTERGIGLSIYRYNLPVGGGEEIRGMSRRTARVEKGPGEFDLSADRKAIEILRGVGKRGVERFVLFANSPPPRLTRNGMTSGGPDGGSNLRPGAEGEFAEYLVGLATRVKAECGLPEVAISPVNEPQWKWGEQKRTQEGCHYEPGEAAAVIEKVVEEVQRRKAGMRVEGPESGQWDKTEPYAAAMFARPAVDRAVGMIGIHSYWSKAEAKRKTAEELRRRFPTKKLAMTEYCQMRPGSDLGIDSGIELAGVIHDDLTIGDVVSWSWWLAVAGGGYGDGLVYASPRTQEVQTSKRLWAMGNYSRFVRPGDVRVGVKVDGAAGVEGSAFMSGDGGKIVCVLINTTSAAVAANVTASGFQNAAEEYVTDGDHDLAKVDPGPPLPARSVVTLIFAPSKAQTRP